jgi:large subunit ribosomal protein L22
VQDASLNYKISATSRIGFCEEQSESVEYRAVHKYAKTSAHKARSVIDLVRGRTVSDALSILQVTPRRAADMLRKLIESAVANATYEAQRRREDVDPDALVIKTVCADDGPSLKRWRPRARGRAAPILKRSSHLTVVIGTPDDAVEETPQSAAEQGK